LLPGHGGQQLAQLVARGGVEPMKGLSMMSTRGAESSVSVSLSLRSSPLERRMTYLSSSKSMRKRL
jgi:hypothetical protein